MMFALGFIAGCLVVLAILVVETTLAARKQPNLTQLVEKRVESVVRPKGAIISPPSDLEFAQRKVIERNEAEGRDTPLEELI